jgi:phosphocarrier protein FPr
LLKLQLSARPATPVSASDGVVTSSAIIIPNPTGLHARPSAVLANVAKSFASEVRLHAGDRSANARA